MNTLDQKMQSILAKGEKLLVSGIPIGYPNLDETRKIADIYLESGIDIAEFSMPSHDPYIDSEIIAKSNIKALNLEPDYDKYFDTLFKIRSNYPEEPFYMMAYANYIKPYGLENFVRTIKELDISGVELPDRDELDPDFNNEFTHLLNEVGIYRIYILHDPFDENALVALKEKIKGFVILQAACDPQGKREKVQTENKAIIQKIKDAGVKVPIILGYGIRDSERVKEAVGMGADGALVGTAMIEQITTGNYKAFADFIRSLKDATR